MKKLLWLLLCGTAFGQGTSYTNIVISPKGQALAGQTIAVCSQPANTNTTPCSPLITTYTDKTLATATSTPGLTTSDPTGNFKFYAFPGFYTVQYYGPQILTPVVQTDVPFGSTNTVIANSQGPLAAITGNGSAQAVYTYTLPANTVALLKGIRLTAGFSHSSGSASVTYALTFNGQTISQPAATNAVNAGFLWTETILNTGATTGSHTNQVLNGTSVIGSGASALTSLNWSGTQILQLTFNVANTDQVTPLFWIVELIQ